MGALTSAAAPDPQPLRVPAGFTLERAVPAGALRFPMFACFDDAGRLYVAESSGLDLYAELRQQTRRCRIRVLADADGDGRFEGAGIFAEQLVFPMGLAWRDGRLYAADPPDLIALEDTDGDGRADRRTVILSGFGHSDNGSLHGLAFGPDGWLYLTMGEPDGYSLKRADGTTLSGKAGALLRCRPDGSEVEVISSGFENLVEVAFLPGGEIVGTLNWYAWPEAGVRDALVHLVEGGRYPLKADEPVLPGFFHGEALPPLSLYPAVALSGIELYRGDVFPGWSGQVFTAQFNARKVVRHELVRAGVSFRSVDSDFLTTDDPDIHFSDVLEDADGSLLAVDTGSWYVHHCPTGRIRHSPATGGLWRVRRLGARVQADPGGRRLDWTGPNVAELLRRLDDSRHAVRERAQLELGRRADAVPALAACLRTNRHETVRAAAAWALGNNPDASGFGALRAVVRAPDDPLAPLAARILARCGDREAEPALLAALAGPQPEMRLAAAEALAHCGSAASTPALLDLLSADGGVFLEHAAQLALHHVASTPSLQAALDRPAPSVQRAALLLLDQPARRALTAADVLARVEAPDGRLSATAQRLLQRHPQWAPDARPVVARLLTAASLGEGQQKLLVSLVRQLASDPGVTALVADTAQSGAEAARQTRALETMRQAGVRPLPDAWGRAVTSALRSDSAAVREAAVRLAAIQPTPAWDAELAAIAGHADDSLVCRLEALRAIVRREPAFDAARFGLLEQALAATNAAAVRLGAMDTFAAGNPTDAQLARIADAVRGDNLIAPAPLLALARRMAVGPAAAGSVMEFAIARLQAGWSLPAEQVEWLMEVGGRAGGGWREKLDRARSGQATAQQRQMTELLPLLSGGDATRGQRVFEGRAACAACHRVGSAGGVIGPDLTKIGAVRAGRDLVESVLRPSATFTQNYEPFRATLPDGETFIGVRVPTGDDTVILRDASGHEERLAAGAPLERARVSLMPEGLLGALDAGEIRDLFAYLQSLR